MFIFQNTKDYKFYVIESISYTYDNQFMTEKQIEEMFADIADSIGNMLDLYNDPYDYSILARLIYLKKHKYVKFIEIDFETILKNRNKVLICN